MKNFMHKWAPILGVLFFVTILVIPSELTQQQQRFTAVFCMVVFLWLFSSAPLFISGLIGVGLTVLLGVTDASNALSPFASPIIFLFMAGFLFAQAMQKTSMDKRLSLLILSLPWIKGSAERTIFCIFFITGFFSMWLSNTATVAMMLPIVVGILGSLELEDETLLSVILLGTAYSASIGGIATPVGSPPNIIAIQMLKETAQIQISFLEWIFIAAPLSLFFIFSFFFYLRLKYPIKDLRFDYQFLSKAKEKLPEVRPSDYYVLALCAITLILWFVPGLIPILMGKDHAISIAINGKFEAGTVGIFMASLLFILPLRPSQKILDSSDIKQIDWGTLLLFGTGLSLGKTLFETGLAQIAGNIILDSVTGKGSLALLTVLSFFTIFFTELASNTATANILIPIVIAMSAELGLSPVAPTILVSLACSLAFMLPVATPPNAIVYGSGKVNMPTMVKLGFRLNIAFGFILIIYFLLIGNFFN